MEAEKALFFLTRMLEGIAYGEVEVECVLEAFEVEEARFARVVGCVEADAEVEAQHDEFKVVAQT